MKNEHDKVEKIMRQEEDIQKKLKQEQVTEVVCVRKCPHIHCHWREQRKTSKTFLPYLYSLPDPKKQRVSHSRSEYINRLKEKAPFTFSEC